MVSADSALILLDKQLRATFHQPSSVVLKKANNSLWQRTCSSSDWVCQAHV